MKVWATLTIDAEVNDDIDQFDPGAVVIYWPPESGVVINDVQVEDWGQEDM